MGSRILQDIVGQQESTVRFDEILDTSKIVLLRIPANLDRTVKNLIGTLVISELLYEVFERADRRGKDDYPYFGIYCDEFQEFATPDFARLFTQTGKFRVMPVVAHQTREQFKPGDPNRGATAASPNKFFFALSPPDAREMPLEFAKEPPSEIRLEEQLCLRPNQEAFADFLIDLAASYSALPEAYAGVLGLYIKLSYGDPGKHRAIPFDLAKSQGLYSEEVRALTRSAEKKTEEERRAFRARFIPEEEQEGVRWRMRARESKTRDRLERLEGR